MLSTRSRRISWAQRAILGVVITSVIALTGCNVRRPDGGTLAFIPPQIAADCSMDVTNALQWWLDSLPDWTTARLQPHACYDVEGELWLQNKTGLTIAGSGSTLKRSATPTGPGVWRQLQFIGSSDITVRDLTINGPKPHVGYTPDLEREAGLAVDSTHGLIVDQVTVTNVWGDGIYLSGGVTNASLTNSVIGEAGRQGFTITDGSNIVFANNLDGSVYGIPHRFSIDLEPGASTDSVDNVTISNNGACANVGFIAPGHRERVSNVTVTGNTFCW